MFILYLFVEISVFILYYYLILTRLTKYIQVSYGVGRNNGVGWGIKESGETPEN